MSQLSVLSLGHHIAFLLPVGILFSLLLFSPTIHLVFNRIILDLLCTFFLFTLSIIFLFFMLFSFIFFISILFVFLPSFPFVFLDLHLLSTLLLAFILLQSFIFSPIPIPILFSIFFPIINSYLVLSVFLQCSLSSLQVTLKKYPPFLRQFLTSSYFRRLDVASKSIQAEILKARLRSCVGTPLAQHKYHIFLKFLGSLNTPHRVKLKFLAVFDVTIGSRQILRLNDYYLLGYNVDVPTDQPQVRPRPEGLAGKNAGDIVDPIAEHFLADDLNEDRRQNRLLGNPFGELLLAAFGSDVLFYKPFEVLLLEDGFYLHVEKVHIPSQFCNQLISIAGTNHNNSIKVNSPASVKSRRHLYLITF